VFTNNTTSFEIHAPSQGIVVLLETWSEGDWRVSVNGETGHVLRANMAFKAVAVPGPGVYRIRFAYRPRRLTESLWWMAVGACCVAAFVLRDPIRRL
jgi:uncharacterized membrane protein YfhO